MQVRIKSFRPKTFAKRANFLATFFAYVHGRLYAISPWNKLPLTQGEAP